MGTEWILSLLINQPIIDCSMAIRYGNWHFWEVGKTRDGRTSVTVKMIKTRDGTVRDMYVTDPWRILFKTQVFAEIRDGLAIIRDKWRVIFSLKA